jgi:hypothetical protein
MMLAQELFGSLTKCFVLGIRGYEFNEFGERLSEKARANLLAAVGFIENKIRTGNFD